MKIRNRFALTAVVLLAGFTGIGFGAQDQAAQWFSVSFTTNAVRLAPPAGAPAAWAWELSLVRQGGAAEPEDVSGSSPYVLGERTEIDRGRFIEWFSDGPKGLQHGFDLPEGTAPGRLVFEFALRGTLTPKISLDRQSVTFLDGHGTPVLVHRELRAVDAEGREATARWMTTPARPGELPGLRIGVDATELVAPIFVRGLIVSAKGAPTDASADTAQGRQGVLAAPANDFCAGAEVIPGGGPFPAVSGAYDITDAATAGDPPSPSCQANVSRSVWFKFTPSSTGLYTFSICGDAPTVTTVDDTVLAIYSAAGACTGFSQLTGGCDDDSCSLGDLQSVLSSLQLTAGTAYYIVAWQFGSTAPPAESSTIQLRVTRETTPPNAPANDQCGGAAVIPAAGPFPYLTTTVSDITGATITGDPPTPSCQSLLSRSIWYSFTPAATASYSFSICADAPTATTVDDTVMAIYAGNGACSGLSELPGGCNDDFNCTVESQQSAIVGVPLTAGTTYYIVLWKYDTPPPSAGNTAVQMRVTQALVPGNDTCGSAVAIGLDTPVTGTTVGALNNYELPAASPCFFGVGQVVDVGAGEEVVYRFTAPRAASYSFRVTGYGAGNAVLYVSSDCPAGAPPGNIAGCLGAANRNGSVPGSEEVKCLSLGSGQTVYAYVDETALSAGGTFGLEVNECISEVEANGTPATASSLACGVEGSIPAFDVDFFTLGIPDANSRVFALVDAIAANATNFDLRVTNATDTLEFDNQDDDAAFGQLAPNIAGTSLAGAPSYVRVNYNLASLGSEPYRLYTTIQPSSSAATAEVEPNNSIASATGGANLYFRGALSGASDVDIFSVTAVAGELIHLGLDLDPLRDNTPFNGILSLLDASGASLLLVNDPNATSSTTSGAGSLTATNPNSPAESLVYRIRSSGTYYAKVEYSSGTAGDYLLSISRNCKIGPPTDLSVSQTDSPDPVAPGGNVTYAITVQDLGAAPASLVQLRDDLPAGSTFVSATPSQGNCAGAGPVFCQLGTIASGANATVTLVVTAPASSGTITNTAKVQTNVIDTNAANDSSAQSTTVGSADSDLDGVPDAQDCAPADNTAWAVPGEATSLVFNVQSNKTSMAWSAPGTAGGTIVYYDLVRSTIASDFAAPVCIATQVTATSASDAASPGGAFFYLVRSENACGGNLGNRSSGTPRNAGACP